MGIKKEISLLIVSAKIELMDRMSDALAFSLISLGTIVKMIVSIIFFQSIFSQVREIGGWNFHQVITLQGTYFFIEAVAWATYIRGFNRISRFVENGDLDIFLTKPINLRTFFIYRYIDIFFSLPQILIGIGLMIYGMGFNTQSIFLFPQFLVLLISAFIIHYSLIVILSTINFFHIVPHTYYLFSEVSKLGQYPIEIYKGAIRLILSIIVPIAFIYTIPAQSLFSEWSSVYLFYSPIMAICFFVISKAIWQRGINRYESAKG